MSVSQSQGAAKRIALTGGPGGGKTTALQIFRLEFGERLIIVPETATALYGAGFPRFRDPQGLRAAQTAIFQVQRSVEDIYAAHFPDRLYLCDRGTLDGSAYWPEGEEAFFRSQGTTLENELARYHAVLFFETAAQGGFSIERGNSARVETGPEACFIDQQLKNLYARHPKCILVPHNVSFFAKIEFGLKALRKVLSELEPAAKW